MPSSIPQAVPASFSLRSKTVEQERGNRHRHIQNQRVQTDAVRQPAVQQCQKRPCAAAARTICPCHQMKKTGIYALAGTLYQLCQNSHRTVSSLKACMLVCQRKCIMHHPHRTACILLINQHGYTDLGGCNHFNIDIGAGQRFEHLRGNAWITGHTGSDN